MKWNYLIILAALACSSCEKESEIITGNTAAADNTVSLSQIRQFIQKSYLATIGTVPSDSLMEREIENLAARNCNVLARGEFIDRLFDDTLFRRNQYQIRNEELLNGITNQEIKDRIDNIRSELFNPANAIDTALLRMRLDAMSLLFSARAEFQDGIIGLSEVQKRMVLSGVFSDIHGGGVNYIDAVFSRFLFRLPTEDERENCERMLNGYSGVLFLQTGSSNTDFINILFSSRAYEEGQVMDMYNRHLFRFPNPAELLNKTGSFSASHDHMAMMFDILLSNEYLYGR